MGENEKATLEGRYFGPISYEWAFRILGDKYREPEGVPIVRIMGQLSGIEKAIYRELEPWGEIQKEYGGG